VRLLQDGCRPIGAAAAACTRLQNAAWQRRRLRMVLKVPEFHFGCCSKEMPHRSPFMGGFSNGP